MGKILKKLSKLLIFLILIAVILTAALNVYICRKGSAARVVSYKSDSQQLSSGQKSTFKEFNPQCIVVLGAGIKNDIEPTPMLKDRLDAAIQLYHAGVANKILLTGDNGTVQHNEIHVMLMYMRRAGVPDERIFCDHAGFSTYDSMYRVQSIFKVKRAVVVTQTYHLHRALFIADKLGIKVLGAGSDQKRYGGWLYRDVREYAARVKDTGKLLTHATSTLGGTAIPITGSGESSHGE